MINYETVNKVDPELAKAMLNELQRQRDHLELIASENFVHPAVLEAAGSVLTNKYAEGYPGKRYYGGCEFVDVAEQLAIDRAKELFGAEHANVQPHSGANANIAVYYACLKPGDTVLGMNLSQGGHLTHGSPVNITGNYFNVVPYGVRKDNELIDYDELRDIAKKEKPKMIIAGATAYSRNIDFKKFSEIAKEVGAYLMVDIAHIAGLVAAGIHENPILYADFVTTTTHKTLRGPRGGMIMCKKEHAKAIDKAIFPGLQGGPLMHIIAAKAVCLKLAQEEEFKQYQVQIAKNAKTMAERFMDNGVRVVSGGTDNHMMLIDLTSFGKTGKEVEHQLGDANITVNKNTIPYDTQSPFVGSGIRIGTPAVTTRGMQEDEMKLIADYITRVIKGGDAEIPYVKQDVLDLCSKFKLYE